MFAINGEHWNILMVPEYNKMLYRSDGTLSVATCDDISKTIYINESLQGAFLRKVLCHEITHAAMFSYNVLLEYEQEEIIADLIATYGAEIIEITNSVFERIKNKREKLK